MTGTNRISNVYQFPVPTVPEPLRRPSPWAAFRARVVRTWWRVRITAAEIRWVLRRPGNRFSIPDTARFAERDLDLRDLPPRSLGPARIIDLDAARLRLRPATPR